MARWVPHLLQPVLIPTDRFPSITRSMLMQVHSLIKKRHTDRIRRAAFSILRLAPQATICLTTYQMYIQTSRRLQDAAAGKAKALRVSSGP